MHTNRTKDLFTYCHITNRNLFVRAKQNSLKTNSVSSPTLYNDYKHIWVIRVTRYRWVKTIVKYFKHLESYMSFDLHDEFGINERIKKSNQSIGALKNFKGAKGVYLRSKVLIYMVITISLLLWGCKSWVLTKVLIKN